MSFLKGNQIIFNENGDKYKSLFLNNKKDFKRIHKFINQNMNIKNSTVGLLIVSSKEMKKINLETREIDKITDVLSFPMNEHLEGEYYLGDVIINGDIIDKQAKQIESDRNTEMKFLFMHSLLHLVGYDHKDDEAAEKMYAKQREIFRELGIRND